jgi:hypothetical protein
MKPTAFLTNTTCGKRTAHSREDLNDSAGQLAVMAIEMATLSLHARRGNPEDLDRFDGGGQSHNLLRRRCGFVEIEKPRLFYGAAHHAEDATPRHFGVRART